MLLSTLAEQDRDAAAKLIHGALSAWYDQHLNQLGRFGVDWEPFRIFPDVYECLDPGRALVVLENEGGPLRGICFYHPRPTHVSVGIVAVDPASGGRGAARAMLEEVLRIADDSRKPVRLVSSLMNLDSFSLYTKLGFVPGTVFQDLQFPPGQHPPRVPARDGEVRMAVSEDLAGLAAVEQELTGLDRTRDFEFFLENARGIWRTMVLSGRDGQVRGFLSSIAAGGTWMLGPGAMRDEADALALITAQLEAHAPGNPVVLVPARATELVQALYAAGARNVELHVAQVRGRAAEPKGIVIPTFLPESG